MSCEDIPSLLDLQKVKKHADDFGRLMGTGEGDSTNEVTGQVRPTFNKVMNDMNNEFDAQILNMGFTRIGTFASGATIANPRQTLLWDIADGGDGQEYGWSGAFPPSGKVVPPGSTPLTTGGISVGAWMSRFDPELRVQTREALRRSYAEAGYNLVDGSFEAGGALVNSSDVLLQERTGKAFSGPAGTVPAGTNPTSGGFVNVSHLIGASDTVDVKSFGLVDGGDITAALISEVSLYCRVNRKTAVLRGTYTMEEDIVIDFNFDGTNATITTDNTCIIGRNTNFVRDNIDVIAPKMIAKTLRPAVTETVGVKITSITNSRIRVPYSKGFTKPLQVVSYGAPVAFNEIYIGKLDDGFLNFAIETLIYTPNPSFKSYVNENIFIGGNFSMKPSATSDPDRAQFYANNRDAGINGNYWLKPCLEFPTYGAGQPSSKFLVAKNTFAENFIIGARTEGIGTLEFEGNSSNNYITLGSQSDPTNVQVLETGGSSGNRVDRIGKYGEARGLQRPIVLANLLSEDRPIFDFIAPLGAGGVQNRVGTETTYSTRVLHDGAKYKKTADSVPRVEVSARAPTGMRISRGTGVATNASFSFSLATNAGANGTAFTVYEQQVPANLIQTASGLNIVVIDVVAHRSSDNKTLLGTFRALVRYTAGSANHSVLREAFEIHQSDFGSVAVSLGNGVGKGSVISPRVTFTDSSAVGTISVEMLVTMSASSAISN